MPLRVLVVEDDALQRELLTAFLGSRGYYVESALDGLEGLRRARLGWFDLVLIDCGLPEIDGVPAARLIAELTVESRRPMLIGMSACPPAGEAAALGVFDAFVSKPWTPQTLLDTIARKRVTPPGAAWPENLSATPARAPARARPAHEPGRPVRVLVADDDELFRTMLASGLGGLGYHVLLAAGGYAALRLIRESTPDIAILDYRLPELDGLAIARLTFDLIPAPRRPRLIALTATPERVVEREAGAISAFDGVIAKSAGLSVLLDAVEHCAAYRKLRTRPVGVQVMTLSGALTAAQAPAAPILS